MTLRIHNLEFERVADMYAWCGAGSVDLEVREILPDDTAVKPRDDAGAILIRFLIDGAINRVIVDMDADLIDSLDYAIDTLNHLREGVATVPGQQPGRCLQIGENGRCRGRADHAEHDFPPAVTR